MEAFQRRYQQWREAPWLSEADREELVRIAGDAKEIEDRFYTDLAFGTAGMRGIMGVGVNRMNAYVVRKATQGLAEVILDRGAMHARRGVAIGYDSRHHSAAFAKAAALTLCANGIRAYLYDALRPVCSLSFAVRHLGCIAGIMITASHNPSAYNGYKVYWEDGAQMPPEPADQVLSRICSLPDGSGKSMSEEAAKEAGLLRMIGQEIDDVYMERVHGLRLRADIVSAAEDLRVVYTPLYGTGNVPVRRILREIGAKNVFVVREQEEPNGDFPGVKSPNPEEKDALAAGIALADQVKADVVIGTDPDCDRMGVAVRGPQGRFVFLTGNQTGSLLLDYILRTKAEACTLPLHALAVKTIVTTELARAIADRYRVRMVDVLTGFKFIAEVMEQAEQRGEAFQFGFEESFGYLAGDFVRDKDAVIAVMLTVEMAAWYRQKNMTLYEALRGLYAEYGYYCEGVRSYACGGKEGLEKIVRAMRRLREESIAQVGGVAVTAVRDYRKQERRTAEGALEALPQPPSDVLYYEFADGSALVVRPSGTEPKIKCYFASVDRDEAAALLRLNTMQTAFSAAMDKYLG